MPQAAVRDDRHSFESRAAHHRNLQCNRQSLGGTENGRLEEIATPSARLTPNRKVNFVIVGIDRYRGCEKVPGSKGFRIPNPAIAARPWSAGQDRQQSPLAERAQAK